MDEAPLRVGAMFAGYGGLELGLAAVWDGPVEVSWYAENAPGPAAVMAHHHPDAPNLGDVTTVDWETVPEVQVITGGTPCQDLSHAGKRGGFTEGSRSNLWVSMREAIATVRPSVVIWENVRGALSARADGELEPCTGCMGIPPTSNMRAFGRVLGDLADLGFSDARWIGLPASDAGAPHRRYRIFVVATHP